MIKSVLRGSVFFAICLGLACGSSSSNQSAGPASCTVTLRGAATGSYACHAIVGFYDGQLAIAILTSHGSAQSFNFAAGISSSDSLHAGTYGPGDVLQEASSLQSKEDDGGPSITWAGTAQNGMASQGSFSLAITSVGPESNSLYEGTKGSVDETLPGIGGSSAVTAHVDFVSIGADSFGDANDDDEDSGGAYDAGLPTYDSAPSYPASCTARAHDDVEGSFACTVAASKSGDTSSIVVSGEDAVDSLSLAFTLSVPGDLQPINYTESTSSESATITGDDGGMLVQVMQTPAKLDASYYFQIYELGPPTIASGTTTWSSIHGRYFGPLIDSGPTGYVGLSILF